MNGTSGVINRTKATGVPTGLDRFAGARPCGLMHTSKQSSEFATKDAFAVSDAAAVRAAGAIQPGRISGKP